MLWIFQDDKRQNSLVISKPSCELNLFVVKLPKVFDENKTFCRDIYNHKPAFLKKKKV